MAISESVFVRPSTLEDGASGRNQLASIGTWRSIPSVRVNHFVIETQCKRFAFVQGKLFR